ncbi:MAG: hypothetical protein MJZ94_11625, partial [Bacteroidales bacterium]|nr:hypothetical protein [Bacteroidales bacterium]
MKRKVFSLMMGLILAFTGLVRANELTVHDGTAQNSNVPAFVSYFDDFTRAQSVYPAAELAAMNGGTIESIKLYCTSSNIPYTTVSTANVYLTEVDYTSISAYVPTANCTMVYSGTLSFVSAGNGGECTITFSTPYTYNGGNLLLGVENVNDNGYKFIYFLGEEVNGASISGYNASSLANVSVNQRNFLPKTTFTYEGGTPAPGRGLHVVDAEGNVDVINMGPRPSGAWMRPYEFTMTYDGTAPVAVSVLDFTPNDGYFTMVDVEYPINFRNGDETELAIATGESDEELVERQFVAIYEGTREAAVWDITAEAYTPVEPDVWEMAREITDAYPFEYRDTPTTVTLYDNYQLPGDAEDGIDAVYKVTFNQDVMLNGTVTTVGTDEMAENAKMAVYTQAGIDEVGGPDLENNYVGPTIVGGGSGMTEYTAYAEGTETIGTLPMYGFYADAYTRSQYVIPATEIAPMAGRTINSLTYYTASTPSAWNTNFQVYLKEVSNTAMTSFIDPTTATTVYTGQLAIVDGMMVVTFSTPYQYNGGNLLIGMDCLNPGTYSSCYFQCVPMTGAGLYAYNYSTPTFTSPYTVNYAPTTTFGLARGNNNRTEYIIENMTMVPGTYYIAASSTEDAWDVVLNAEELPCPEAAYQPTPADDADELEPSAVTLKWKLGEYATEYRLVFGSTYYCEDVLVDWTTDLAESYTVTGLYNNTNYFWRVDVRNGNC